MKKWFRKLGIKVIKTMSQAALGGHWVNCPIDGSELDSCCIYRCPCRGNLYTNEPCGFEGGIVWM